MRCSREVGRGCGALSSERTVMLGVPASSCVCPLRLCGVTGYDGRINDVVYCYPSVRTDSHTAVIFFGGDVQDFTENMETHR